MVSETKKKRGRPADIESILKAKKMIASGISYREIMRALKKKNVYTIYRWAHYVL